MHTLAFRTLVVSHLWIKKDRLCTLHKFTFHSLNSNNLTLVSMKYAASLKTWSSWWVAHTAAECELHSSPGLTTEWKHAVAFPYIRYRGSHKNLWWEYKTLKQFNENLIHFLCTTLVLLKTWQVSLTVGASFPKPVSNIHSQILSYLKYRIIY